MGLFQGPEMRYSVVTGNPVLGGWCAVCGRLIPAESSALGRAVTLRGPERQVAIAHKICLPVGAAVVELADEAHRPVYFGVVGLLRGRFVFWGVGPSESLARQNASAWLATERNVAYPELLVQSLPCIAIDGDQYERAHDRDRSADHLAHHPVIQAYVQAGHEARKQEAAIVTLMGPRWPNALDAKGQTGTEASAKQDERQGLAEAAAE